MEMRKLINIITEGRLPAMPSDQQLNALSVKYAGREINDTHTKNWLYEVEPMALRLVIAANLGFLDQMLEEIIGYKSGFLEFDWDTMLAPHAYDRPFDVDSEDDEENDSYWYHIEQYVSPEIQQLLNSNGLDNVSIVDIGNNTMIMLDHDSHGRTGTDYSYSMGAPGLFYHGDPQRVIQFLKKAKAKYPTYPSA